MRDIHRRRLAVRQWNGFPKVGAWSTPAGLVNLFDSLHLDEWFARVPDLDPDVDTQSTAVNPSGDQEHSKDTESDELYCVTQS